MKRTRYFLLCILLSLIGVTATKANVGDVITSLDQLSNNKCYTISTKRGKMVMNTAGYAVCSSHTGGGSTVLSAASTKEADGQWVILKLQDKSYYLFNVGKRQFLRPNANFTPELNDANIFEIISLTSPNGNYLFKIKSGSNYINNNNSGDIVINSYSAEDDGNKISFVEAGDFDGSIFDTEVTLTYNYILDNNSVKKGTKTTFASLEYPLPDIPAYVEASALSGTVQSTDNGNTFDIVCTYNNYPFKFYPEGTAWKSIHYWYDLKINNKYIIFDENTSPDKCSLSNTLTAEQKTDNKLTFAFIGDPLNGFRIVNYGKGEDYTLSNSNDPFDGNTGGNTYPTMKLRKSLTVGTAQGNDVERFNVAKVNDQAFYLQMQTYEGATKTNISMNDRGYLAYWTDGAGSGSYVTVERVALPDQQKVDLIYNYLKDGEKLYSETITATEGDNLPSPKSIPHGVTIQNAPTGNVETDKTSYDINVTYTTESTGIKFFDSIDEVDTWYAWTKRNAWYNARTAYVYHINDVISYPFDDAIKISDDNYLWAAIGNPFSFKICNKGTGAGYFLSNPNATINDGDTPTMKQEEGQSYFLYDCTGGTYGDYCFQVLGTSTPTTLNGNGTLNYWVNSSTLGDPGSQMRWIEPNCAITSIDDLLQGQIYTITSAGNRGSFIYTANGLSSTYQTGNNANEADPNQQFTFVKHEGKYYLYSIGAKAFINITGKNENNNRALSVGEGNAPVNTTFELLASTNSQKSKFPLVMSIDGHHVGISNGFTPAVITHYNDLSDEGNALCIKAVWGVSCDTTQILKIFTEPNWQGLITAIATAEQYTIGTAFGQYTATEGYTTALADAKAIAEAHSATKEEVSNAIAAISVGKLTLNMPKEGALVYIKDADGNYMTCTNTENNRAKFSADKDKNAIFCFTGNALVAYSTGYFASRSDNRPCNMSDVTTESESTIYHFHPSALTIGKYFITFGGDTRYMYKAADAGDTPSDNGYDFTLEAVESIPVSISSAKMATLYSPVALDIPEGVTAYTGQYDSNNSIIKLTELQGVIPANTGVIIEGEAKDYDFNITDNSNETESCLSGTVPAVSTVSGAYTLQIVNNSLGLYKYTGTSLGGFKAYLVTTSGSKGFALVKDDDATGIDRVENIKTDNTYYDLNGRVVMFPQKNQIYILNGEKVIIR